MSLEVYVESGFKFFPCRADKSPDIPKDESWKDEKWHIDIEKAETLQTTGGMIGAWFPDDIIALDLDRHEGKPDGLKAFREIKKTLGLSIDFIYDTTVIQTGGNGYHVLFYVGKNHGIKQGAIKIDKKEIGIDVKTSSGYVIASGSPGYKYICNDDPMELPDRLREWLLEVRGIDSKPDKKESLKSKTNENLLNPDSLRKLLNKIPVENFQSNDRWLEFITSAIATAGDSQEIIDLLEEWSRSDPKYTEERSISNRIASFTEKGGITAGSFIMFLREEGISNFLIDQVISATSITASIINSERNEIPLPFEDPDYYKLADSKDMEEFYQTCGNSSAKRILKKALNNNVMFVKGDKETYFFNGSRWEVLKDYFSIIYTILFRVTKIRYAAAENTKENKNRIMKIIKTINDTTWKNKTMQELQATIREDFVNWDSPDIRETVTTNDGVIDFSKGIIQSRKGLRSEFRLRFVDYKTDEILNSEHPTYYIDFMKDIFPEDDTFKMALQAVSLCITGNSEKRIFQLWEGDGFNGKSTLIDIIKKVLQGKTNTYDPKLLMPEKYSKRMGVTPELYAFRGSYAAVGTEVDQGGEFSMGIIKNLTGGDDITANPKFKDQVEFSATWQLILAVNDLPRFNALDGAFIDRLLILPFVMTYPKDDVDRKALLRRGIPEKRIGKRKGKNKLLDNILSQKAGIIKHMIDEYLELENKYNGLINESIESKRKKSFYIQDNDDYGDFVKDVCMIDEDGFCTSEEITEAFKDYMGFKKASSKWIVINLKKYNRNIRSISKEIIIHGEYGDEKKRRRGLSGIRLKTPSERLANESNYEDEIPF